MSLSREQVLRAAVALADRRGLAALTIRSLAQELGVKPMTVYYYVATKEEILDAIVELVFAEIDLPSRDGDWRTELRGRAVSARQALRRHPWALTLLDSRTNPGPATLRQHDATIATLRHAGFDVATTAHAYTLLDSYVYGFAIQESALPFQDADAAAAVTEPIMAQFAGEYPHLAELARDHILRPGYDFAAEFEFGLDAVLDTLARMLPDDSPA